MGHDREQYEANVKAALSGVKKRRADIVALVRESVARLAPPADVSIALGVRLDDHVVWIDAESILKTLINLETNALEAMPAGGELVLDVEGDETQVVITLRDTGCGISQADMDRLFTPFFSTKPAGEGTGLSLPRAYATVKQHGGKIDVASNAEPERGPTGTTVTITLPRARPDLSKVIRHHGE